MELLRKVRNKMPLYEYVCKACEHNFDTIQKMNDDPLKKCPACGKMQLNKKISAGIFKLPGRGFYKPTGRMD